ncbi:MAG: Diphthamide biosynthesis protein 1 [Trichoglossum hirsutum]|nr:MAG: Diphthamide biosynthesis protein 1 [Trichoglossum hirsutum]
MRFTTHHRKYVYNAYISVMEDDRDKVDVGVAVDVELTAETTTAPATRLPKRRFVGRRAAAERAEKTTNGSIEDTGAIRVTPSRRAARTLNQVPSSILDDPEINAAIALLPPNYSFEIPKTIHRIRTLSARKVALQFPEGLLLFATTISDILTRFCPAAETLIMGDVTYGACCIDDFTARALGCDLLVHYAHSCLVPVDVTQIKTLYVFVDIAVDNAHLIATIERNFPKGKTIAMVGTIQFNATIHGVRPVLEGMGYSIVVPQIAPLSKGEILGCTSPRLNTTVTSPGGKATTSDVDVLLYLGDGRFHLESAMIHNPFLPAYRYDPYSRTLTHETYAHPTMHSLRSSAISLSRTARSWGLILGTLGRQGNPATLSLIEQSLRHKNIPYVTILLSEIFPGKLAQMSEDVEAWVQVACPRLSIDWGYAFERPLLSPYEALVALGEKQGWDLAEGGDGVYPMDYYAKEGLGRTRDSK